MFSLSSPCTSSVLLQAWKLDNVAKETIKVTQKQKNKSVGSYSFQYSTTY